MSRQKFGWLPENHTDFIPAVIGEELGYIGVFFIILLIVALYVFGTSITSNARADFGTIIVMEIMLPILYQAALNMAVIFELFLVIGMLLPFISSGEISSIILCMMMG